MQKISTIGAHVAPSTSEALQRARIAARLPLSPAVLGVVALLAYGHRHRDDDALLVGIVADRTASAGAVRL